MEGRQPALGVLGEDDGVSPRVLVALSLVAVVGAGCGSDDRPESAGAPTAAGSSTSTSASPTQAPPPPPAPDRGACYRLSYDKAVAPTSDDQPVGCDKPHTSQTYAVGRLDTTVDGHLVAVDSATVQKQVAAACPKKLAGYLGGTDKDLQLSLLRPVWFTPTVEQSDRGAAWYRCDVIAVAGDEKLAKITGDLKGALGRPKSHDDYAMCATDQPGTPDFQRVPCGEGHSWKAITTIDLTKLAKNGSYPGPDAVQGAGDHVCADAARAIAADALNYQWGYEWPTKAQWLAGQTYGRCWAPD